MKKINKAKLAELAKKVGVKVPESFYKGEKGDAYTLTAKDKEEIASKITVPTVEKIIEKTEVIRETPKVTQVIKEELDREALKNELIPQILRRLPAPTGNANRNIQVEGATVLRPYTDINLVGTTSSILAITDNTNKTTIIQVPTGGGGTPGGANTQVQFNDAGAFAGSTGLTFNKGSSILSLGGDFRLNGFGNYDNFTINPTDTTVNDFGADLTISAGIPTFNDNNLGGNLTLSGGNGMTGGSTSSKGGTATLKGGNSFSGNSDGGNALVIGGTANGTGAGGLVEVRGGPPAGGVGGGVVLQASGSVTDGFGSGGVTISGGTSTTGNSSGGSLSLNGGGGRGNADGGGITILSGTGGDSGNGGSLSFQSGNGGASGGFGGLIQFGAGDAAGGNNNGGDIFLYTGSKTGSGAEGRIKMQSSPSSTFGVLDFTNMATTAKTFTFPNATGTIAAPASVASAGQYLMTTGGGHSQWASVVAVGGSGITRQSSVITASQTGGATAVTDYAYFCAAGLQLTLPTAVGNGNLYTIKNTSASSVLVATTASQTIDGSSSALINAQNISLDLLSDGSNWAIV